MENPAHICVEINTLAIKTTERVRKNTQWLSQVEDVHKILKSLCFPDFEIPFGHHPNREKPPCHTIQKARFQGPTPYALSACQQMRASPRSVASWPLASCA